MHPVETGERTIRETAPEALARAEEVLRAYRCGEAGEAYGVLARLTAGGSGPGRDGNGRHASLHHRMVELRRPPEPEGPGAPTHDRIDRWTPGRGAVLLLR